MARFTDFHRQQLLLSTPFPGTWLLFMVPVDNQIVMNLSTSFIIWTWMRRICRCSWVISTSTGMLKIEIGWVEISMIHWFLTTL
jgi:hypothetical protein